VAVFREASNSELALKAFIKKPWKKMYVNDYVKHKYLSVF